jgi:hypothetical protein
MSVRIGSCGICGKQKIELEEHHVVEYLDNEKRFLKFTSVQIAIVITKNTEVI